MNIMDRIRKTNHRLGRKIELKPENVGEVLRANFYETCEYSSQYQAF
ncbi:MAG: hypothetical protein PHQ23_10000 [Candidatus Wallbacteria bacterium]|nr:hypothetical protein [Candidatus Wallbacteria bacterium]